MVAKLTQFFVNICQFLVDILNFFLGTLQLNVVLKFTGPYLSTKFKTSRSFESGLSPLVTWGIWYKNHFSADRVQTVVLAITFISLAVVYRKKRNLKRKWVTNEQIV